MFTKRCKAHYHEDHRKSVKISDYSGIFDVYMTSVIVMPGRKFDKVIYTLLLSLLTQKFVDSFLLINFR